MNATLPVGSARADYSIASMDIGSTGWVVPWAMYHDSERKLWLNGKYTIDAQPRGTVQMLIRRDENGWHVDASRCGYFGNRWSEACYFGGELPVAVASFRPK